MNEVILSVSGNVVSDPIYRTTKSGEAFVSFRLAVNERKRDENGVWQDGETNYFSVTAFRVLASNTYHSIKRGQLLMVTGRLRITRYDTPDGQVRTSVQIDAHDIGASMKYARTSFEKCTVEEKPVPDRLGDDAIESTNREMEDAASDTFNGGQSGRENHDVVGSAQAADRMEAVA